MHAYFQFFLRLNSKSVNLFFIFSAKCCIFGVKTNKYRYKIATLQKLFKNAMHCKNMLQVSVIILKQDGQSLNDHCFVKIMEIMYTAQWSSSLERGWQNCSVKIRRLFPHTVNSQIEAAACIFFFLIFSAAYIRERLLNKSGFYWADFKRKGAHSRKKVLIFVHIFQKTSWFWRMEINRKNQNVSTNLGSNVDI